MPAEREGQGRVHRVGAFVRELRHRVVAAVDIIGVVAGVAAHRVDARVAAQQVVAVAADQRVVAAGAKDDVGKAVAAQHQPCVRIGDQVLDVLAERKGHRRLDRVVAFVGEFHGQIFAVVDMVDVVAGASLHRVGFRAAAQHVMAFAADQRVVAAVAVQHVITGEADQRVVELAAGDRLRPRGADAHHRGVRRPPEHHVARAGTVAVRIGAEGADDQVVEAVAVDVARRGDREAAAVARRLAADLEAVAAVEARQVDVRGEAAGLAEHHIARAGTGAVRIGARRRRRSGRRSRRR